MEKTVKLFTLILVLSLSFLITTAHAEDLAGLRVIESASSGTLQKESPQLQLAEPVASSKNIDASKYTLGPDDVVQIDVLRHPEFSGLYPVNLEGKIQYKFVGDIVVTGLNKTQLEEKIKEIITNYVINPEVNVTIVEFKSKVIFVLGEVGQPGKYIMRSDSISVRDAVVNAGLPTLSAAMRRCRIITPAKNGRVKTREIDIYAILYGGNLKYNIDMHPGDVLYVPATMMAKVMRVINPVTQPVASVATTKGAAAGF